MPVFEEKYISPLAIRFTQHHIRTTFRDGRPVASTIPEIQVRKAPAGSEYDVVLHAPFPHVEIVRWRVDEEGTDSSHWFTLDNRRLYCLQQVAVSLWPQRVAVAVEILYNDLGRMRRKFDSTTYGWAVSISHSLKEEELSRWDWRLNVPGLRAMSLETLTDRAKGGSAEYRVLDTILDDDEKQTTEELTGAQEEQGMLAAFLADADADDEGLVAQRACSVSSEGGRSAAKSTSSTRASNADSDSNPGEGTRVPPTAAHKVLVSALKKHLDGCSWRGNRGEVYTLQPKGEASWTAVCTSAGTMRACRNLTLAYDEHTRSVWWGSRAASYYVDATSVCARSDKLCWYGWDDRQQRPRFSWTKLAPEDRL